MKKIIIIIPICFLIILIITSGIYLYNKKQEQIELENKKILVNKIQSHYNNYVKTNKNTKLYKKNDNKYIEYGSISKDVSIELEEEKINYKTKYFKIKNLELYIKYNDVDIIESINYNDRYKNYISFNKNIKTKNITRFFDKELNLLYTINDSFDFNVIINDEDFYGVIYNNQLLYIKSEDVETSYNKDNGQTNKNRIKTLTYHFIYDQTQHACAQVICQSFEQFESHLKYIRENNYFTLKLDELEMYLDGKINIPEKSIVLTIDDGTYFDLGAIDLLEKYQANATLFVITKIKDNFDYLESDYLDLESHTENMHNQYECRGYGMQGGGILCLPEDKVLNDLKTSQDKLGGSEYFAYPFFDFNDRAIELLKKAGFNMAFIGQYDTDGYSYPKVTSKYKVRRKTIFSDTTMNEFISYLQ